MPDKYQEVMMFEATMQEVVEIEKEVTVETVTRDHTLLANRDAPDQHPISAIIGLQEILDELRAGMKPTEPDEPEVEELYPETTQPKVTLETAIATKAYEAGDIVTPTFNAALDPGSYTYGPDTGVTATAWEITDTAGNTASTAFGTFEAVTVTDGESDYKITATATHGSGAMPVTNTGKAYPAGQIVAGTKSATMGANLSGHRKTFYGTTTDKGEITSDVIRGLSGKSEAALAEGSTFTIELEEGAMRVIIAYPATLRNLRSVKDENGMNANIVSSFQQQIIPVAGANGYEPIDYKVYVLNFAMANDTYNNYHVTI